MSWFINIKKRSQTDLPVEPPIEDNFMDKQQSSPQQRRYRGSLTFDVYVNQTEDQSADYERAINALMELDHWLSDTTISQAPMGQDIDGEGTGIFSKGISDSLTDMNNIL